MYRLLELWARLVGTVLGRRRDADLDREMACHLELAVDDGLRRGLSRDDARAAAVRDLGGLVQTKERFREQLTFALVHDLLGDVRYACRSIAARKMAAAVTILTIALGVGANAAVFAVAYGVMWRPLPFAAQLPRLAGDAPVDGVPGGLARLDIRSSERRRGRADAGGPGDRLDVRRPADPAAARTQVPGE
jgi:hypothetical protein